MNSKQLEDSNVPEKCHERLNIENSNFSNQSLCSSNININDLDEETNERLRGDAIGDTLYSQTFVLKTLLQFSNLEWNEQVEENLCFLWDMTVEKDVCTYLLEMSYPTLACSAILKYKENRFIEIVIGILANILCVDRDTIISDDLVNIILQEIDNSDPLILVQVMRFIISMAHRPQEMFFVTDELLGKLRYILVNSMNSDLLTKTLETVAKLTTDFKLEKRLVDLELYNASLTAYSTIVNEENSDIFDNKEIRLSCRFMLEVVCNICSYADNFVNCELLLDLQRNSEKFVNQVIKILEYFSSEENLLPVTEELIFFMSVFRYTFITLNINYISKLFTLFCRVLILIMEIKNETVEIYDSLIEIVSFFIFCGYHHIIEKDLKQFSISQVRKLLTTINENQYKYEFELNLKELLNIFK